MNPNVKPIFLLIGSIFIKILGLLRIITLANIHGTSLDLSNFLEYLYFINFLLSFFDYTILLAFYENYFKKNKSINSVLLKRTLLIISFIFLISLMYYDYDLLTFVLGYFSILLGVLGLYSMAILIFSGHLIKFTICAF